MQRRPVNGKVNNACRFGKCLLIFDLVLWCVLCHIPTVLAVLQIQVQILELPLSNLVRGRQEKINRSWRGVYAKQQVIIGIGGI